MAAPAACPFRAKPGFAVNRAAGSVPPERPDGRVHQAGRQVGDFPGSVDAVVGEHDLLGGDALGGLQGARRALPRTAGGRHTRRGSARRRTGPPTSAAPQSAAAQTPREPSPPQPITASRSAARSAATRPTRASPGISRLAALIRGSATSRAWSRSAGVRGASCGGARPGHSAVNGNRHPAASASSSCHDTQSRHRSASRAATSTPSAPRGSSGLSNSPLSQGRSPSLGKPACHRGTTNRCAGGCPAGTAPGRSGDATRLGRPRPGPIRARAPPSPARQGRHKAR